MNIEQEMKTYHCDYRGCEQKPHMEIFIFSDDSSWSYLCRRHYYWVRFKNFFKGTKKARVNMDSAICGVGYGRAETESELFNRLLSEHELDRVNKLEKENKRLRDQLLDRNWTTDSAVFFRSME